MDGESANEPEDRSRSAEWRHAGKAQSSGYFWYFAAVGAFFPFAALYYRDLGFSGIEVGLLTALPSIGAAVAGPFFGAFADARSMHRSVLRAAFAVAALTALIASRFSAFSVLFALIALVAIASAPISPLLDSYGMTISEGLKRSYGSLRIWGSVGYMALTLLVGRIMGNDVSSILLIAYAAALIGIARHALASRPSRAPCSPVARRHGRNPAEPTADPVAGRRLSAVEQLGDHEYVSWHPYRRPRRQHDPDRSRLRYQRGERVADHRAGRKLLARFGPTSLITLSLIVYTARFILLSVITEPVWILPVQALHGLSFGAFLMASVTLAYRLAGPTQAATAQALLTAMSYGFGSITGALVGGALLDRIGTEGLFRGAAVMMVFTLAVLLIGNRVIGLDRAADDASTRATA